MLDPKKSEQQRIFYRFIQLKAKMEKRKENRFQTGNFNAVAGGVEPREAEEIVYCIL